MSGVQDDRGDRGLEAVEHAGDERHIAEAEVDPRERDQDEQRRQHEQTAGHDAAPRTVHEPADVRRELLRLGAGQQHAVVQRVQEALLADPAPALDELRVHDRDLSRGSAEADEAELQPETQCFAETDLYHAHPSASRCRRMLAGGGLHRGSQLSGRRRLKVATWNVNSLRVRLPHVLKWLEREQPDLLALQETKLKDEDFPADTFRDYGYVATFSGQSAYNGVAILSREPPSVVSLGLGGHYADEQKRVLGATFGPLRLWSLYVPNGQSVDSDKVRYKLEWLAALRVLLADELARHPALLVVGDFNIAPDDRDVHNPAAWARQGAVHAGRASGARGTLRPWAARRIQAVRAAREDLQLVGLPRGRVSPQSGAADRPRARLASVKSNVHGVPDRQGTARLGAAFGPRAGRRRIRCQLDGYVTWSMWATRRIS